MPSARAEGGQRASGLQASKPNSRRTHGSARASPLALVELEPGTWVAAGQGMLAPVGSFWKFQRPNRRVTRGLLESNKRDLRSRRLLGCHLPHPPPGSSADQPDDQEKQCRADGLPDTTGRESRRSAIVVHHCIAVGYEHARDRDGLGQRRQKGVLQLRASCGSRSTAA